jgi:hypothetical protein
VENIRKRCQGRGLPVRYGSVWHVTASERIIELGLEGSVDLLAMASPPSDHPQFPFFFFFLVPFVLALLNS